MICSSNLSANFSLLLSFIFRKKFNLQCNIDYIMTDYNIILRNSKPFTGDRIIFASSQTDDLAFQYRRTAINQSCLLSKTHINCLNELKKRDDILILPLDKGSGFVIINRTDYVNKMEQILADKTKFVCDTISKGYDSSD